jgi:hypothetical protein
MFDALKTRCAGEVVRQAQVKVGKVPLIEAGTREHGMHEIKGRIHLLKGGLHLHLIMEIAGDRSVSGGHGRRLYSEGGAAHGHDVVTRLLQEVLDERPSDKS